jgi:hypothetical protein
LANNISHDLTLCPVKGRRNSLNVGELLALRLPLFLALNHPRRELPNVVA